MCSFGLIPRCSLTLTRHKRIGFLFESDPGRRSVSRNDAGLGIQSKQSLPNRRLDGTRVTSPQIRSPDPAAKQGIARQEQLLTGKIETEGPRGVPGRMQRLSGDAPERQRLPILNPAIRIRHGEIRNPKRLTLYLKHLPQPFIIGVQAKGRLRGFLNISGCQEMVEMRVGVQDTHDRQAKPPYFIEQLLGIPARIDNDRFAGFRIPQNRTIAPQGRNRERF